VGTAEGLHWQNNHARNIISYSRTPESAILLLASVTESAFYEFIRRFAVIVAVKEITLMQMFSPTPKTEPTSVPPQMPKPASAPARQAQSGVLSSGVSIKGSVKFASELVIDGDVEGTISSVGRLTVGKNAHIRGEINTGSVMVYGTIDGNVTAVERCELHSGCTLRGDIEAPRLVVDEDATFLGSAKIATGPKSAQ
jgi:cytoskeletal protein CcmA (bactofilin family)